jgi:hypothetical protein
MSGKTTGLTALETRKQLLLVESELNRAQLINEVRGLKSELNHLKHQAQAIASIAESTVKLAGTFSSIGNIFSSDDKQEGKPSLVSRLLKGIQTGATLWSALRRNRR